MWTVYVSSVYFQSARDTNGPRVHDPRDRQRLPCICQHQLSKSKEQGTCYIQLCYITHLRIHAMTKTRSKLHVIIHGYIVTVRYVNIYD